MRTLSALTPDERSALAIWQAKLKDSTLSCDQHAIASTEIQKILHSGPFGDMYEALSAFDAKLDEIKEGKTAKGVGRVEKELRELRNEFADQFNAQAVSVSSIEAVCEGLKDEVNAAVQAATSAASIAPDGRVTAVGAAVSELKALVEAQGIVITQLQAVVGDLNVDAIRATIENLMSAAAPVAADKFTQLIKDEVDSQVRAAAIAAVHDILGEIPEDAPEPPTEDSDA